MNNYASVESNVLDDRLKLYIRELNMYRKIDKDTSNLKKKYNITSDDIKKIKKYIIDKKYFSSIELRNNKLNNNNDTNHNHNYNEYNDPNYNINKCLKNKNISGKNINLINKSKNNKSNDFLTGNFNSNLSNQYKNNDNVFTNPLFFDDCNNLNNVETYNYKFPLYPAAHELDVHFKKHNNGTKNIINSIDKYNKYYDDSLENIINTNHLVNGSILSLKNIDVENEFKKGLPSRSFINDKRNKDYDNPIEHYFSYIDNDIQDPDHVVMQYPIPTRMSNKEHTEKYNL